MGHARAGAGGVCACGSLASALPSAAADTGQFRERCIVTRRGATKCSSERSERGSVLARLWCVVRERSELDNAKRERHSVVIGGGGGLCVAWGCKVSSFLCKVRWGMSRGTSRFLPVYLVESVGTAVEFFEPWQEWLPRTAIFDFLGLKLDNLFKFEDSVTVEGLGGGCVLCVLDFYVGDIIAFREGGLVAAIREPRF